MKFIHCADLHLDQPFQGLGRTPMALREKMITANQSVLTKIVDTAILEKVDFVLIVGDTFHQPIPTVQTQQHFIKELERLNQVDIPVVLTFGNHDYYQKDKYWFEFPGNTLCFTDENVETIQLVTKGQEKVAISGFSYVSPEITEEKALSFPSRNFQADFHLGLYHGQVGRTTDHPYAPFQLSQLERLNYDYWALGHIHQPTVISEKPLSVYPGSPLGHTKKEKNSRGFVLIESRDQGLVTHWHTVKAVRWEEITIDLTEIQSLTEVAPLVESRVQREVSTDSSDLTFLGIAFSHSNQEMSDAIEQELAQKELLRYLQEKIYHTSAENCWVFELTLTHSESMSREWPFGIDSQKVSQMLLDFKDASAFDNELNLLFRQPEFRQLFGSNPSFRAITLAKSAELLGLPLLEEGGDTLEN